MPLGYSEQLATMDSVSVQKLLRRNGWITVGESVRTVSPAGDGNMNVTVRVKTTNGSLILKQGLPYVAKYPLISAPVERTAIEYNFYHSVTTIPDVSSRMPRPLGFDKAANVLALEDLGAGGDLTSLYHGVAPEAGLLDNLAQYLAALQQGMYGRIACVPENRQMRRLNWEHIFVVPLDAQNGLDLDRHEPGLRSASAAVQNDAQVREVFRELGARYLATGPCLIHGDFFPGSWISRGSRAYVIDPEFAFAGDPEFDVGVALAHLRIAGPGHEMVKPWWWLVERAYARHQGTLLDQSLVVRFAAVEMIRRLIGVAQLPMPRSHGRRAALLDMACHALRSPVLESLLK